MDPNLIIDDDYVYGIGTAGRSRAFKLEKILDEYLTILKEIKSEALVDGEIAQALDAFIECVGLLNNQLTTVSESLDTACVGFIQEVNDADQFLF